MIEFLTEEVRAAFHSLPLDRQKDWIAVAESHAKKGQTITILYIEGSAEGTLEVSIRVNE